MCAMTKISMVHTPGKWREDLLMGLRSTAQVQILLQCINTKTTQNYCLQQQTSKNFFAVLTQWNTIPAPWRCHYCFFGLWSKKYVCVAEAMLTIPFVVEGIVRWITLILESSFVQRLLKFGDIYGLGIVNRNRIATVHSYREETKITKYNQRGILTQKPLSSSGPCTIISTPFLCPFSLLTS